MTLIIVLTLALYFLQIFLQETSRYGFDLKAIVGPRDNPPQLNLISGRLERAKNNMLEALPIFLGLALVGLVKGGDFTPTTQAAFVFLVARIFYVPAYLSGVIMLRSAVWLVSVAALFAMAISLI